MGKRFEYVEDEEPIELVFNGEMYLVAGVAPANTITDLAKVLDLKEDSKKVDAIGQMLNKVLLPDYRDRFNKGLTGPSEDDEPDAEPVKPIGFKSLLKSFEDLVEHYTEDERPTEDPSSSQDGSETSGASSTPSAPSEGDSTLGVLASPGA